MSPLGLLVLYLLLLLVLLLLLYRVLLDLRLVLINDLNWHYHFIWFGHHAACDESWDVSGSKSWGWWNISKFTGWRGRYVCNIHDLNLLNGSVCLSNLLSIQLEHFLFLFLVLYQLLLLFFEKLDLLHITI